MSEEEQIILPDGYTKLDYISSDGFSYIQLPVRTAIGDKVVLETNCKFNHLDNQAEGKNGNPFFFFGINSGVWYCGAGNYGNSTTPANTDWHKIKLIHSSSDCGLYIDDNKILSLTYDSSNVLLNGTISVFRTSGGNYYCKNCKKDWKLYINDELVYNLIPCLDNDGVPCMYDILGTGTIVENTYYNRGAGRFLIPKDFEWNYPQLNNNYNLPAGFKKCIYLQSDGTQWIDTGHIPTDETGLYIKAQRLNYGDFVPFGARTSDSVYIQAPRWNTSSKYMVYGWNTYSAPFQYDKGDDLIYSSSLNLYNDRTIRMNSEDTKWFGLLSSTLGTMTYSLWLFSYSYQGAYNATYGNWGGRIYRAQITQGIDLIHDYVPCLDADNRPCMYDLITQEAYYNQSGGTEFAYCVEHQLPSDFVKLKYLESIGTQFIKTGYVPTNTTGLYIDTQNVGSGDTIPMGSWNSASTNTRFFITRQTTSNSAGYGWGTWTEISATKGSVRYDSTLNWLNDRKSITNNPLFVTTIKNLGELPFTPSLDIWMFGINQGGGHAYKFKGRIYRAKISEGSEIVRDFVPAYDQRTTKPCMYDLINNVAYYNDGTEEFTYNRDFEGTYTGFTGLGCIGNKLGSDYNPVSQVALPYGYTKAEFLESTGTQYIKTEVDPHHLSYKIVFDGFNGSGSGLQLFGVEKYTTPNYYWYGTIIQNNNNGIGFNTTVPAKEEGNTYISAYDNPIGSRGISEVNFNENYVYTKGALQERKLTCGDYTERILATHTSCALFANQNGGNKCKARVYSLQGNYHGIEAMNFIPAIDPSGVPCMYDTVTDRPFYNNGTGQFIVGMKTLSQAISLRLPETGGTLQLSLPTNDNVEYYEGKIRANNPSWNFTFSYH